MRVLILGNGIAGVSAALRLRELRPDWEIAMVSGESTYPYSRPALMYIFMGDMPYRATKLHEDSMWAKKRIELVRDWAVALDTAGKRVRLHRGGERSYDRLLLAVGSKPNRFDWPGQDLGGVQGLYGLQDLALLDQNCRAAREAVVVGGGLIGIELAEMLHARHLRVTLLVREARYWGNVLPAEEARMVEAEIERHGIGLRLGAELELIEDDGRGRAAAVRTRSGERLAAQVVGLTAGVSPNLDLVRETDLPFDRGVIVDRSLRTPVEHIWAAGDCAEIRDSDAKRGLVQQVWYTGRFQGRAAAESMAGEVVNYDPGIWFNSAKFLDLEYQTYGSVPSDGQESLWWQHPSGRAGMRIALAGRRVVGFNFMGTRRRHQVCERWLAEGRELDYVLAHLSECDFDSEFTPRFDGQVAAALAGGMK